MTSTMVQFRYAVPSDISDDFDHRVSDVLDDLLAEERDQAIEAVLVPREQIRGTSSWSMPYWSPDSPIDRRKAQWVDDHWHPTAREVATLILGRPEQGWNARELIDSLPGYEDLKGMRSIAGAINQRTRSVYRHPIYQYQNGLYVPSPGAREVFGEFLDLA